MTTPAPLCLRAACAAVIALALAVLAGCGGDGAGASGDGGATQTAPGSGGGTGPGASRVAVTVSAATPVSGNGAVSGSTVVDGQTVGTTRAVVADGTGAGGLAHRIRIDYDAVSGLVLAVSHGWGPSPGTFEATTGCVRVLTQANPTLCTGATLDAASGRVTFSNTLLRGSGVFTSLLNGTISLPSP